MPRAVNDAAINLIKSFEGCRLNAYPDVAGIWTIGYGHIKGVTPGMAITQAQADQTLRDDLMSTCSVVDDATKAAAATTDNQFGAMVSLCFNIGALNFRGSTVLRQHLAGEARAAAAAFLLWNKARINGQLTIVMGLTRRRQAESDLYLAA